MSLADDIVNNITGFSKAMYSTWFYYKPERFLFDAGEGVSTALGNSIFGIKSVFLTHGHYDHIGGLPGIILSRNSAMGDKTKPLTIYHPEDDNLIKIMKEYIKKCCSKLTYELIWESVKHNEDILLDKNLQNRLIRTFATDHLRGHLTLGYNLIEKRNRLREDFLNLSQEEIFKLVKEKGKSYITEPYEHIILSYVGDSMPVSHEKVMNAEVLMHEASFIYEKERKYKVHATLEEAVEVAKKAGVKYLLLYHISSRYSREEINRKLSAIMKEKGINIPTGLFLKDHMKKYKNRENNEKRVGN